MTFHIHIRAARRRKKISLKQFALRMDMTVEVYRALEGGYLIWTKKRRIKANHALNRGESWPDVTNYNGY